jgi:putative sterol carrier protein
MADATAKFFDDLASRGHERLLEKTRGTIRVDLENGKRTERWLVAINKGDVRVSHANSKADTTIRASKEVFNRVASGETNAMAAMLRGAIAIDGNFELLVLFQRLFPSPPDVTGHETR